MKHDSRNIENKIKNFPSHHMSRSTQDQLHQQIINALDNPDVQSVGKGMMMSKLKIWIATAAAIALFSILGVSMLNNSMNTTGKDVPKEHKEETQTPTSESPQEEKPDITKDPETLYDPAILEQKATEILHAIHERKMDVLANYAHSEKGILFSPYYSVSDNTVVFEKNEIKTLLENNEKYLWGYGEANTEIRLTPSEYFDKHLQVELFFNSDEVFVDRQNQHIDYSNYLKEVFPNAKIVEFYHGGTEKYSKLDWKSVNLVFEQNEAEEWQLVAIVNNLFTP